MVHDIIANWSNLKPLSLLYRFDKMPFVTVNIKVHMDYIYWWTLYSVYCVHYTILCKQTKIDKIQQQKNHKKAMSVINRKEEKEFAKCHWQYFSQFEYMPVLLLFMEVRKKNERFIKKITSAQPTNTYSDDWNTHYCMFKLAAIEVEAAVHYIRLPFNYQLIHINWISVSEVDLRFFCASRMKEKDSIKILLPVRVK